MTDISNDAFISRVLTRLFPALLLTLGGCTSPNPEVLPDRVIVRQGLGRDDFTKLMEGLKLQGPSMVERRRYVFTADGRLIISRVDGSPPTHEDLAAGLEISAAGNLRYHISHNPYHIPHMEADNDSSSFCSTNAELRELARFISAMKVRASIRPNPKRAGCSG